MLALALIASGSAFLFAACSRADPAQDQRTVADRRPNVLVVLVDTLRADRVEAVRGDGLRPGLSQLASESVFYERA